MSDGGTPPSEGAAPAEGAQSAEDPSQVAGPDAKEGQADVGDPGPADHADDQPARTGGETLHGHPLTDSLGQAVVHTDRHGYLALCQALRADGYDMMIGVTGVDYLVHPGRHLPPGVTPERFEVVVELVAVATRRRLRVRCQVPGDDPRLPTLFDVWPGSEAHERETYDMYGVVFEGHPDPSRILMPEDWEGHPLRKDYATGRIPVQFKETPGGR